MVEKGAMVDVLLGYGSRALSVRYCFFEGIFSVSHLQALRQKGVLFFTDPLCPCSSARHELITNTPCKASCGPAKVLTTTSERPYEHIAVKHPVAEHPWTKLIGGLAWLSEAQ